MPHGPCATILPISGGRTPHNLGPYRGATFTAAAIRAADAFPQRRGRRGATLAAIGLASSALWEVPYPAASQGDGRPAPCHGIAAQRTLHEARRRQCFSAAGRNSIRASIPPRMGAELSSLQISPTHRAASLGVLCWRRIAMRCRAPWPPGYPRSRGGEFHRRQGAGARCARHAEWASIRIVRRIAALPLIEIAASAIVPTRAAAAGIDLLSGIACPTSRAFSPAAPARAPSPSMRGRHEITGATCPISDTRNGTRSRASFPFPARSARAGEVETFVAWCVRRMCFARATVLVTLARAAGCSPRRWPRSGRGLVFTSRALPPTAARGPRGAASTPGAAVSGITRAPRVEDRAGQTEGPPILIRARRRATDCTGKSDGFRAMVALARRAVKAGSWLVGGSLSPMSGN